MKYYIEYISSDKRTKNEFFDPLNNKTSLMSHVQDTLNTYNAEKRNEIWTAHIYQLEKIF